MLSTALRQKPGREQEGLAKLEDAKKVRKEILGSKYDASEEGKQMTYDRLVVVHVR